MFPPNLVFAFHGCTEDIAEGILMGRELDVVPSENKYDWLGKGAYFWENDYQRALEWAQSEIDREKWGKKQPKAAVIGAIIDPGRCLDLQRREAQELIRAQYNYLEKLVKKANDDVLPTNTSLRRNLDCAVLNEFRSVIAKDFKIIYDTVRGAFVEGEPIYENSYIQDKNHIQWAVINPPKSIIAYFRPRPNSLRL